MIRNGKINKATVWYAYSRFVLSISLSYNNFLDVDSCWKIACSLPKKENMVGAVIVKHLNPCGAAYGKNLTEALQRAKKSDPRSHFGGVIAVNTKLEKEAAEIIAADFAEIIIAPEFSAEALTILQKSKNLRIIECSGPWNIKYEMRSIGPGVLVQELDTTVSDVKNAELKSTVSPTANQYDDLALAWNVCSHVKSNAIVLAKDGYIIGVGAGQMSRIDSVEIAVMKAKFHGHDISGAVAASDAFFPFPDSVEYLASHGVKAIIAPGGAKRDGESIDEADKVGIALLFASDRHFRH